MYPSMYPNLVMGLIYSEKLVEHAQTSN